DDSRARPADDRDRAFAARSPPTLTDGSPLPGTIAVGSRAPAHRTDVAPSRRQPHAGRDRAGNLTGDADQQDQDVQPESLSREACYLGAMEKPKLKEHDGMVCRSCGNEERASEGYRCAAGGTYRCVICTCGGVPRGTA